MNYELTGAVKLISDTQTFPSGFSKREFVVTTDADRYPQDIKLEFVKEKTALLDSLSLGDRVRVSFDIRGSEYNGKYFVNLSAWKIGPADGDGAAEAPPARSGGYSQGGGAPRSQGSSQPPPAPNHDYSDEDIPF